MDDVGKDVVDDVEVVVEYVMVFACDVDVVLDVEYVAL